MYLAILFIMSLCASSVGAVCGVGGGVIIKPALDALGLTDVSSASFLSACTVLIMTGYSVFKEIKSPDKKLDMVHMPPLAFGAAIGGVAGKYIFEKVKSLLPFADMVGAYQAVFLGIIATGLLIYTIKKQNIKTKRIDGRTICFLFGIALGCMSSFLGIGGGPIDLVILMYFFSMDTKTAAQNSLFIIFIAQLFSLGYTFCSGSVPAVKTIEVLLMVAGGFAGGIMGRKINATIDNNAVDKLFIILLGVIMLISIYNFFRYI